MPSREPPDPGPLTPQGCSAESLLIGIAVAVVTAAVLMAQPLQSANDRSRWCTVWSLVERRTYQIDEIDRVPHWSTIDKVRHRKSEDEPWHLYSSKPPLLSTLVAGLYAIERVTLGYGLFAHTTLVTRLLLLIVNVLPFALSMTALRNSLRLLGTTAGTRTFVLGAAGFGSMINPYLTTLNNHTLAAACVMLCLASAIRLMSDTGDGRGKLLFRLGLFAALASCFELPAALLGIAMFVLAVRTDFVLTWKRFVPGALIPLSAFFVTNVIVTGGIRPFYTYYGTSTYEYVHEGIPSYWLNPQDLDANQEDPLTYLFHCILGHHGLISLTPVLILAAVGMSRELLPRQTPPATGRMQAVARRAVIALGTVLTVLTLSFYLSRTRNYNYGGNSVALRWLLWLSPFWWIGMVPALETMSRHRWRTTLASALLLASVVSVSVSLPQPWQPSWLFRAMESAGWIDYRTAPEPFDPPRRSVIHQIPDRGITGAWTDSTGRLLILQSAAPPAGQQNQPDFLWVQLVQGTPGRGDLTRRLLAVDKRRFDSGDDISDWMVSVWKKPQPEDDWQQAGTLAAFEVRLLLRGLPARRPYIAQGPVWQRLPSRPEEAYRLDRGAAQVVIETDFGEQQVHRCDVMYCDEVPFGVLRWQTTTSDAEGRLLATSTWQMVTDDSVLSQIRQDILTE